MPKHRMKFMDRLAHHVADMESCWLPPSGAPVGGYSKALYNGRMVRAHRLAYELLVGPIPEHAEADHLCRVKGCYNPWHLEMVSKRENILRGIGPSAVNARKTHCIRGHALEGDNLFTLPDGSRRCRACQRARWAKFCARNPEAVARYKRQSRDWKRAERARERASRR